jgi:hypothetical protein
MSVLGEIVTEVVAAVTGEAVGAAAERPMARLTREVRQRISVGVVVVLWLLVLGGMVYGWSLASRNGFGIVPGILWFGGPVFALWVTAQWFHRRDA